MTDIEHLAASTRLFNQNKFLEGLEQIDNCIQSDPHNSVLYSNRALFLVELGHIRQAIKDLKFSIELDYLNYVSYFNLFSIHVRQNNFQSAVEEIHCALSAIYLIAAKQTKTYEYATKAVSYAKNNTEARVLKGLMELEQGKFRQAHEELVWACGIETDNILLAKVRDLIKKIGDSAWKNPEQEAQTASKKRQNKRLESSFCPQENSDLQAQIRDRIIQFNRIYEIVSEKEGLITEKVGQRGDKKEIYIRQKSSTSQNSNIGRTDPDKEATNQISELNEPKAEQIVQPKVIQEIENILQIAQPVPQQESNQILEDRLVQLQASPQVSPVDTQTPLLVEQIVQQIKQVTLENLLPNLQHQVQDTQQIQETQARTIQPATIQEVDHKQSQSSIRKFVQETISEHQFSHPEAPFLEEPTPEQKITENQTDLTGVVIEIIHQVKKSLVQPIVETTQEKLEIAPETVKENQQRFIEPTSNDVQTIVESSQNPIESNPEKLESTPVDTENILEKIVETHHEIIQSTPEHTQTFFEKIVEKVDNIVESVQTFVQEVFEPTHANNESISEKVEQITEKILHSAHQQSHQQQE